MVSPVWLLLAVTAPSFEEQHFLNGFPTKSGRFGSPGAVSCVNGLLFRLICPAQCYTQPFMLRQQLGIGR